ncbi:probable receptor-like protein kinase At1g80640 [Rosa chinensis]|uniref:probable receptor-like protein kinase At1g80640 n=1 Tax=Rosa chinensis TaxID=74649 RepID=UPI000D0936A4|nr:probable receptor-like protein kinase At1g80640 [Rosa chinensis]
MSDQHEDIYQKTLASSLQSHTSSWRKFSEADFVLGLPLEMSWEMVEELTHGFRSRIPAYENGEYLPYEGLQPVNGTRVTVKRYTREWHTILQKEKKAALSMRHKNILRLIAFYDGENTTVLAFPFTIRGPLHTNLYGSMGKQLKLKFQEKLKIAIDIARGLRYMHEECPQGPIVHGNLLITNIFLRNDLRPMISGFGQATWLHLKQTKPNSNQKCSLRDHLDREAMALVKFDIQSYGVLLLRLFCKRSTTLQDDRTLTEWARPLLMKRAFHELLDEDWEDVDMHEMFRVMCTAYQCTMSRPDMRPCISEIISYLKGENFCVMQTSPSDSIR